jgi:very-short-patch-repair endonuclease
MYSNNHYNKNLKNNANELRSLSVSRAEKFLWKGLKKGQQGVKFKRQRPINYFIVDFFAQEIGLIIEIDGNSHYQKAEYDEYRQKELLKLGYQILRFSEGDVMQNIGGTLESIQYAVHCLKNKDDLAIPPPCPPPKGED